jgi:ABC-type phosphate/phosphonate transport system substrate-binding protein
MLDGKSLTLLIPALLFCGALGAADVKAVNPSKFELTDALIFAAPPRESAEEAVRIYQPMVEYLSKAIGKRIVFKYPRTWGVYRTEMINDRYDLVFDGPHFISYRVEKLGHNVLAKLSDTREFVVVTRKDEKVQTTADLVGRTFCVQPPPNLAALIALSQFDDARRQPVLVPTKGWDKVYNGILSGRCVAGVFPESNLQAIDKERVMKVLYKSPAMPEQALSASPRVSAADQAKIIAAMTAAESAAPTERVRATAKGGERFVRADNKEYTGIASLLKKQWGFYD